MMKFYAPPIDTQRAGQEALEDEPLYSVAEAAIVLGVSPSTVWRWIDAGKLPAYRVGPRSIRIRRADLHATIRPARAEAKEVRPMEREQLTRARPSPEELARRQALVKEILELRKQLVISPLTTADLIHKVRQEERRSYGKPRP
jgi:excisionase family DNA binding protein